MASNEPTALARTNGTGAAIEGALIGGDLSRLSAPERTAYYMRVCESVGLNPYTKPFEYLRLGGKEVLYATRNCTDQLRAIHRVSVTIVSREKLDDVYVVTARATTPDGRVDESTGAVTLGALKGDNLCNALMKAETKAKRRVTLSICGLSMLDETETETAAGAVVESNRAIDIAAAAEPEAMTAADEQAKRRAEAEAIVPAWIADVDAITTALALSSWCEHHGYEMQRLHPTPQGRVWTAVKHACKRAGVSPHDARKWLREAEPLPVEPEPDTDEPSSYDSATGESERPPDTVQALIDSFAKVHSRPHFGNAWKKHGDAVQALEEPWRGYVLGCAREAAMRAGVSAEEIP